jgi:nucleoside-diphosphate-sugar epimerase
VLLTGGTGFVGKEILWQAARDDAIAEVVVLIRPKTIRDRKTGEVVRTLSPAERGESLLRQLWLDGTEARGKYSFVAGDVEEPHLGIAPEDVEELAPRLTHVIHCAASVAFDDPYEKSFDANVRGTLNALRFSHRLQSAPGSPFVAHLGIETSYIHGRQVRKTAREEEMVFPRNFYNNYYELTKAMASIETERFILEKDLRVIQLCPSIVIGESQTGNNRGDTKVVNAPVNLFGRAAQTLSHDQGGWIDRSKAAVLTRMACVFPGDPSAELNIIPVDRVVEGILAALRRPEATGRRIHLATDNRVTSEEISRIVAEELDVQVKLADPTTHRAVTLPVLAKVLAGLKQERLAQVLEKLSNIFGGYSEWGQPVHEVGRDVELLGLSPERPDSRHAFRMLCRHNRWVQEFGRVKDPDEISRREKVWRDFVRRVEGFTGRPCGALSAEEFRRAIELGLDGERFELK